MATKVILINSSPSNSLAIYDAPSPRAVVNPSTNLTHTIASPPSAARIVGPLAAIRSFPHASPLTTHADVTPASAQCITEELARHTAKRRKVSVGKKPAKEKPIPKSAEYILDSDDSDEPLAQVVMESRATQSKYFGTHKMVAEDIAGDAGLSLARALARRKSWTPPPLGLEHTDGEGFEQMCKTFSYSNQVLSTAPPKAVNDFVQIASDVTHVKSAKARAQGSVRKVKRPAKKPSTITGLSVAAFAPLPRPDLVSAPQETLHQPDQGARTSAGAVESMPPPKQKSARKAAPTSQKAANKSKPAAKAKQPRIKVPKVPERVYPPLLSPSQARSQLTKQAFIFGTSSQLQAEEAPSVLQDIQQALEASEKLPSSPPAFSSQEASNTTVPNAPHGTILSAAQTRRNLWRASARNAANGTFNDNDHESQQSLVDSVLDVDDDTPALELSSDHLSSPLQQEVPTSVTLSKAHSQPTHIEPHSHRSALRPVDANRRLRSMSPPALKVQARDLSSAASGPTVLLTPKRRGRPPKAVTIASPTQQAKVTPRSSPPSRWYAIDEIMDSEASSPSPARKRASPPVTQLEMAAADTEHLPTMSTPKDDELWSRVLPDLFVKITGTVRSTPRSNSLTHPTWYEKMLIYDPIVIEDFTAWLNQQGLRVKAKNKPVSKKRKDKACQAEATQHEVEHELAHWMVQRWCEENSVCCLWKEGLRGGVRTRY